MERLETFNKFQLKEWKDTWKKVANGIKGNTNGTDNWGHTRRKGVLEISSDEVKVGDSVEVRINSKKEWSEWFW